ncbi:hypothetical protein GCM10009608_78680 [Pseudonocardia alaniniphila]
MAPLLDAHAAESALTAPPTDAVFGGIRQALEQILTLDAFLTDYGVTVSEQETKSRWGALHPARCEASHGPDSQKSGSGRVNSSTGTVDRPDSTIG